MANTYTSTNMNLVIPVVGTDPGPDWASNLNISLTTIDSHDHSTGKGVQITPTGLNISSDLTFQGNNATNLKSSRYNSQSAVLTGPSDLGCLYNVNGDLYYNDGSANNIRITQSGGVAGTPGSISNLTSPASAAYVSGSQTFVWQSAANTAATMDAGSLIIRNLTASSYGITLQAPTLASNYNVTLPSLPASQAVLEIDSSGNISAVVGGFCPTGVILPYGGASAPNGWLFADGSVVSQSTYAGLYATFGSTYNTGGEGAGNFRLPNMSGNVAVGPGGSIAASLGATGGEATHTLSLGEIPSHTHTETVLAGAGGSLMINGASGTGSSTTALQTLAAGGGGSHNNVQPYLCLNYIVKT